MVLRCRTRPASARVSQTDVDRDVVPPDDGGWKPRRRERACRRSPAVRGIYWFGVPRRGPHYAACDLLVCAPAPYLAQCQAELAGTAVAWGAQDDRNGYPLLADLADRKLAMEMVELYFEHIGSKRRYAALLGAEDPVVIDCEGMRIRCTLDAAWRTTSGSHDVEEYKTIAALPQSTEFLSLNFQRQAYHYAAVQKYGPGGQVLYMFQRREVPPGFGSRPLRMNKNGSVAKNNASQNRDDYMQQVAVPKSPEAIARFERNVREKKAAVKMYRASGVWPRVPIMSGNESCDKCPYFKLCDAEANGSSLSADALHAEYYHSPVAGRDQGAFAA